MNIQEAANIITEMTDTLKDVRAENALLRGMMNQQMVSFERDLRQQEKHYETEADKNEKLFRMYATVIHTRKNIEPWDALEAAKAYLERYYFELKTPQPAKEPEPQTGSGET